MEEQFVTYEIALQLQKLGFEDECLGGYHKKKFFLEPDMFIDIPAPLWQQVFDWFRITHNKMCVIYTNASGFLWEIHDAIGGTQREWSDFSGPNDSGCWDTYEECRLALINHILKIIKL